MTTTPHKVAVIGGGNWGQNLVRNFYTILGPERTVVCDTRPAILAQLVQRHPGLQTTTDFQSVLGDPSVDGVAIATPVMTHHQLATQALEAGKHVFVEKPLTTAPAEAEELCALAERLHRVLMVDHLLLFHPAYQELDRLVKAGELGDLYHMHARRTNLGVVRTEENALWSLGPHDVAVALQVIGKRPSRVSAQGAVHLQPGAGIQDVVFVTMSFPGGQLAHLHLSWLDPSRERKVTFVGSRKMAIVDEQDPTAKLRLFPKGADVSAAGVTMRDGKAEEPKISNEEPLALTCKAFLDSIDRGKALLSDGRIGLEVVRVLQAGQESLDAGGAVITLAQESLR